MRRIFIVLFLLCASPSWAAVTLNVVSSAEAASTGTSVSHTKNAADNYAFILATVVDNGGSPGAPTSITYGASTATLISGCQQTNTNIISGIYYVANPPSGAQTVSLSSPAQNDAVGMGVFTVSGASGVFGTCVPISGASSANIDINSIGSASGDLVIGLMGAYGSRDCSADATSPVSTEQYQLWGAGNDTNCGYTEAAASPTTDIRVDLAAVAQYAAVGVAIKPIRAKGFAIFLD